MNLKICTAIEWTLQGLFVASQFFRRSPELDFKAVGQTYAALNPMLEILFLYFG